MAVSQEKYKPLTPKARTGAPASLESLPVELLDLVISFLPRSDQLTFSRCSLRILTRVVDAVYGSTLVLDSRNAAAFISARVHHRPLPLLPSNPIAPPPFNPSPPMQRLPRFLPPPSLEPQPRPSSPSPRDPKRRPHSQRPLPFSPRQMVSSPSTPEPSNPLLQRKILCSFPIPIPFPRRRLNRPSLPERPRLHVRLDETKYVLGVRCSISSDGGE
ncbi:hypothetical protein BDY24DRAFT_375091 [Mrakia frigida]|uniref:uncharacterized protein n=1 Tax=Mrakia frigida TaxID=29902 RepID=UPI003FCC19A9